MLSALLLGAALTCGEERWAVKTLMDRGARDVRAHRPVQTTIADLNRLPARCRERSLTRVAAPEWTVYEVEGRVTHKKRERDNDFHIVLADGGATIIAEVPEPGCAWKSPFLKELRAVRRAALRLKVGQRVRVKGVGFYDFSHGQTGMSRSCLELHPLLWLEVLP